jgi:hypothetical protein
MLRKVDKIKFLECIPSRESNFSAPTGFDVFTEDCGNFTVVVVSSKNLGMAVGVAKRNPSDIPSEAGFCIAAVRAWRDFSGKDPGYSRQRPVSKREAKLISVANRVEKVLDDLGIDLV